MVIRLKDAAIEQIEDTDTKRLKLLRITSKEHGAIINLELPEALSSSFSVKNLVDVIIDSKPIPRGEKAQFYAEGSVFRLEIDKELEMVGTIGGLRLQLSLSKLTPAKKKTFDSNEFFIAIL